jgi:hydrophobe/amphiphile efflux-1 (HAE1) family protein
MRLPRLAIENYPFTLVVFIMLLIMGVISVINMPRTEDPPMDIPGASVIIIYPGGNPVDLEELIANPVEESLNELDDIKVMNSWIRDGIVSISVEFNFETNADDKFDEVVRQVNSIRSELPEELYDLQVLQWSSTDVVMLQMALVSESAAMFRLNKRAEELKEEIERLSGVRRVEIFASPEREVRISLDMQKMAVMNISVEDVSRAIQSSNANIPGGELRAGMKSFNVKTSGSYKNLEEIQSTVVASYQGSLVYLSDIADARFDYEDYNYRARFNGQRAVFVTVKQKEGLNIFKIADNIFPAIEEFRSDLDPDIRLETVFDQTESVDSRINGFFMNLIQGIILVGIVIFLSLGFRASILVIIAIPLSILIGLGWVDVAGFGLQQISIAALVIALGLLVDNSIVITENIERFMRKSDDRTRAASEASSQLAWPIITATLTTILAFIPIITMPDKAGRFIQSLPVTVILTLLASLLIALTLTPFLASRFFKTQKTKREIRGFRVFLRKLIEGPYRKTLIFSLRRRWLIILISVLVLAGAGFLFTQVGVSFFPKAEKPQFLVRISIPEGYSIEKTDQVSRYVESVLDTIPEVEVYATNVGHGNPRIYYNTFPRRNEKNFAEIFVELRDYEVAEFDALITNLRETFSDYPGARINVKEFEQGAPIEAPLTIKITGDNLDTLRSISTRIHNWVENTEGVVNPENNLDRRSTDLWFKINREKANMLGVPIHTIDLTLRTAIAGSEVSVFRDESGKEYGIVMRLPLDSPATMDDIKKIYIKSLSGEMIPVRQLINIEYKKAPGIISHYNLSRDATITGDIEKGYSLDEVIEELDVKISSMNLPKGYSYRYTGELESREESFGGMARASIIAMIAIFAVLILQFGSFSQPLIIFSAIPLALIGSTLALYITGYTFSFTAFIGLISLIGIVVNNSIILVDYANVLQKEGLATDEALREAGETRFTPIILTTLTTIGGLLPLTLQGGTLWAPMGWTIIGGLLVSTFLTLVVVPVLYKMLTP